MLPNAVEGVSFPGKKDYEGERFNDISVTRGCVGVKLPGKKRYVTLEWPLITVYRRYMKMVYLNDNITLTPVKMLCLIITILISFSNILYDTNQNSCNFLPTLTPQLQHFASDLLTYFTRRHLLQKKTRQRVRVGSCRLPGVELCLVMINSSTNV